MKLALHWKILIGMILGLLFGIIMKNLQLVDIVIDWVKPFGTIFINLLKRLFLLCFQTFHNTLLTP